MINTGGRTFPPRSKSWKPDSPVLVLQAAKVLNYAKWQKTSNSMFVVFVAVFLLTRLVFFPFWWEQHGRRFLPCPHVLRQDPDGDGWWVTHSCVHRVIHCTWVYPLDDFPPFFGYYFFNVMLTVLLVLHVYWAFLILRMFYKLLTGKVGLLACVRVWLRAAALNWTDVFTSLRSWKVMTGAMKRRTTLTHRWKKSPGRVTSTAPDSEAEPAVTDPPAGGQEPRARDDWREALHWKLKLLKGDFKIPQQWILFLKEFWRILTALFI